MKRTSGAFVSRLKTGFDDRSLSADQLEASLFQLAILAILMQGSQSCNTPGSRWTRGG